MKTPFLALCALTAMMPFVAEASQCRRACKPVIQLCVETTGATRSACRKATLRACRQEGISVCTQTPAQPSEASGMTGVWLLTIQATATTCNTNGGPLGRYVQYLAVTQDGAALDAVPSTQDGEPIGTANGGFHGSVTSETTFALATETLADPRLASHQYRLVVEGAMTSPNAADVSLVDQETYSTGNCTTTGTGTAVRLSAYN